MNERTERHTVVPDNGLAGEGHEGMPGRPSMNERTERHTVVPDNGLAGEGHEGMPKVGTA